MNRRIVTALVACALFLFGAFGAFGASAFAQTHAAPPQGGHDPHAAPPASFHGENVDPAHPLAPAAGHGPHDKTHPEGADHGAHHGPEPINWTNISDKGRPAFAALVINLGLLLGLYYWFGKKPITQGLKQRRVTIGKDIDEAREMLAEAKERAKKYQGDLKNADADAATAKATLIASGKGEVERMLSEAAERAERMKRDAERLVGQEGKHIAHELMLETVEHSLREAEEVLKKNVTQDDHARLAQDLLAELAKAPAATTSRTA